MPAIKGQDRQEPSWIGAIRRPYRAVIARRRASAAQGAIPAPLPPDEEERLEALRQFDILDTLAEQSYDDITALAARICGTPIALISLVDKERQWFKSKVGLDADQTPRDLAFCSHAILDDHPFVIPDARNDSRFAGNPLVTDDPRIRFYAGAPLITSKGFRLGTLCVIDRKPHEIDSESLLALQTLSRQVALQLELRRTLRQNIELEESARQTEAEFKRLFENMQDVVYRTDLEGKIQVISPSVERYGYSVEELIGAEASALYDDWEDRELIVSKLMAAGSLNDFEVVLRHKDGTPNPMSGSARVVRDSAGQPKAVEGILRDIADRKQLERQRRDFVAMVVHDIRNPTMTVSGLVDLALESEALPDSTRDLLERAGSSAATLLSLVKNYLDGAKIESGAMTLQLREMRLGELIEAVCAEHDAQARERGVRLDREIQSDLPLLGADPPALERVFANLIGNALKFTPAGGVITIRSRFDADMIHTSITDTGPGVVAEDTEKIFALYGQASTGPTAPGIGLGLFIVKSLVELHGGTVAVESPGGAGAVFTVSLPTQRPAP